MKARILRLPSFSSVDLLPVRSMWFAYGVTVVIAAAFLYVANTMIVRSRTLKYAAALLAVGVMLDVFLSFKARYSLMVFLAGFTMPFYVEFILIERDSSLLALTGTFLVTVGLATVALSTGAWSKNPFTFVPLVSIPALASICAGFLSLITTTDRTITFISLIQAFEMLAVFLVLVNSARSSINTHLFLRGTFIAFTIECGIYVLQNILGYSFDIMGNVKMDGGRSLEEGRLGFMRGTFGTPHVAGTYFAAWTLLLIGFYLCSKRIKIALNPVLGILIGGGCLILNAKRGPWLGFAIGLVFMVVMLPRVAPRSIKKLVAVGVALGLALVVLLPVFLVRADANHESALEERLNLNRVAWQMFHAHPIVGVGLGTYDTVKKDYLPEDWSGWLYEVHNQYMLTIAETGTVGFIAAASLYLCIILAAWRGVRMIDHPYKPLQVSVIAALLVVFWEMFWNMWDGRNCQYLLWFLAATAIILPNALPAKEDLSQKAEQRAQ